MIIDLSGKRYFLFFRKKTSEIKKISLTEQGKCASDNAELCRIFNNCFSKKFPI